MIAVTAIDEAFFPGLLALRNSIRVHSPSTRVACYTYGDDDLARRVEALGVEVRHNADIGDSLPPGDGTPEGCKPMYARLLAPLDFGDCVWLDADQIVQRSLLDLFVLKFNEPVAVVEANTGIDRTVTGIDAPRGQSIYSGLMRFNYGVWRRERITERCLEMMGTPGVYWRYVVQSVLSVVLANNFFRLDPRWQGFANRPEERVREKYVLHWHGREVKPWTHPDTCNAGIWRKYAEYENSNGL